LSFLPSRLIVPFRFFGDIHALSAMPSTQSPAANVPSHNRRQSAAGDEITLVQTETRHDFQVQGSAKHLERLASAKKQGAYGATLQVRPFGSDCSYGVVG
jgi:hypothetical protein